MSGYKAPGKSDQPKNRREFLKRSSLLTGLGLGAGLSMVSMEGASANLPGYKSLVIIHLNGGNDANDLILPLDAGFNDYERSRPSIALRRDAITPLSSRYLDRTLGVNRALDPIMPLFHRGNMAFLVNAGALVKPTTAADVLNRRAVLPPFLYSHPEQTQFVQGWMGDVDPSGWAGRAIEAMDPEGGFRSPLVAVNSSNNTVVRGQRSRVVNMNTWSSEWMGPANLSDNTSRWTQMLDMLSRQQSNSAVESEYARTFRGVYLDNEELARADRSTREPAGNFDNNEIARRLRKLAKIMPYYKTAGASRQVYFIEWGSFDTHTNQRYTNVTAGNADQDTQLRQLANALAAFDTSLAQVGLSNEVVVFVTSEFSRTLDPAAGNGSDHAWGSHWMVMGADVMGARMYGQKFPMLVLGGEDDAHDGRRGYFVPQLSSDQVAADLLLWLGLPAGKLTSIMPNLQNFAQQSVGFMRI
jgi:uncharacterized protein (DUF1501 family)